MEERRCGVGVFSRLFPIRKRHGRVVPVPDRRSFGTRCGDDPLWTVLNNQHP
ncbi:hypothetical protein HMPREF0083_03527 [Aneurinibacillus aneurinilyticus ATCC 12856]|uniref:Uncharacterized protein n=1 Tax=Aneurinibacillus aneurinilyticus ATCC 12856 TaxID=649747 RepID=U1Y894_ANEAE|nr:hypothetical protein HMPREF0083_03527 [Aneurinibacillus aneurinilyticus ATCC 12856]